jgi:hypothetical protein
MIVPIWLPDFLGAMALSALVGFGLGLWRGRIERADGNASVMLEPYVRPEFFFEEEED